MNAGVIVFLFLLVFSFLGLPIFLSIGVGTVIAMVVGGFPLEALPQKAFLGLNSSSLLSIPFFILAGNLMARGITQRLIAAANVVLGRVRGSLGAVTVLASALFGAISGSAVATVAAIGAITIPAMVERGYDKRFAAALVACAGSIGVMIPPSNPMVVYGVIAKASIGKLFLSGIIPGILVGVVLMGYSYYLSKKNGWMGNPEKLTWQQILRTIWEAKWALMVPVIILGGIYGGYMTPTEAAAISAMYGLLVGIFVYKGINRHNFFSVCIECCTTSAVIIFLIAMASSFGYLLALEQVPESIAKVILSVTNDKYLVLLLINLFLLVVGALMEPAAATIILTPILAPIATKLGVDLIHFGLIMTVNLAIGFVTPPVGSNLFVASATSGLKVESIARAAIPMIILMIAVLFILTYVPAISLFLPNHMM